MFPNNPQKARVQRKKLMSEFSQSEMLLLSEVARLTQQRDELCMVLSLYIEHCGNALQLRAKLASLLTGRGRGEQDAG